jgi:hypothetical protein
VQLFHYHLVTSRVRDVEARYIGKLSFDLVARHGRIGEELTSYESGVSWHELDAMSFKLRLTELEKGAVNVVIQPGQWPMRTTRRARHPRSRTSSTPSATGATSRSATPSSASSAAARRAGPSYSASSSSE